MFASANIVPTPLVSALASDAPDMPSREVQAMGWGVTTPLGFVRSDTLNVANLQTVANDACQVAFGINTSERTQCARSKNAATPCLGDSGGPLLYVSGNYRSLIGVLSQTRLQCGGVAESHSVFTRVAQFRAWANGVLKGNGALCMSQKP